MDYKKIGITVSSKAEISGEIKQEPGDFVVQEILVDGTVASLEPTSTIPIPQPPTPKEYTQFTLVKRDWNQDTILKKIARLCGVSRKRFSYAGTKDKFALTAQRITAWKIPAERLAKIKIKDCTLGDFSSADKRLELGDLWGNRFSIRVRSTKPPSPNIPPIESIPNFFGQQRFGMRLNNHIVGKLILKDDIEAAVKEYLTGTTENEGEEGKQARLFLAENWGSFNDALKKYPKYLRFEKALLNQLVKHQKDYVGAFKKLSKNMYKLFTHAYQSHLFNQELSEKIKKKESLEGEGNLIGYGSTLNEFEKKLIEREGFEQGDFRVKPFPEASVRGGMRHWKAEVRNFKTETEDTSLVLKFDLEKGAYATILLRELLK